MTEETTDGDTGAGAAADDRGDGGVLPPLPSASSDNLDSSNEILGDDLRSEARFPRKESLLDPSCCVESPLGGFLESPCIGTCAFRCSL